MTGYVRYSNEVGWKLWAHLEDAVREGSHRWKQAYGWDGPIFSSFFRTDEARREFLMGMHGFGCISSPLVVAAFDLGRFRKLVDLGGATGHLAVAACRRYPALRAAVFDLPEAAPLAREIVGATEVADRVGIVAGDFFADTLPAGDLYALGRILHDWTEEKCLRLLGRIHAALPAGGALLIVEKVVLDDRSGPRWALMQDLNMLTCTEGRERTLAEYESLLTRGGFCRGQRLPDDRSGRRRAGGEVTAGNLFAAVPARLPAELAETLWQNPAVRVERIVSRGHATRPGEWYDQAEDEWVVLLSGAARLRIEGEPDDRLLGPGDYVLIQAGRRHRVEWTDPESNTVWLAVHTAAAASPGRHAALPPDRPSDPRSHGGEPLDADQQENPNGM